MRKITEFNENELETAAIKSAANMGPAEHLWHPDYGWILRDGEFTEAGREFIEFLKNEKNEYQSFNNE